MKKIFLLAMFCMINSMQADDMSEAIQKCDKKKVQFLLSKKKLTTQQIVKYLDTAEQTVRFRRDILLIGDPKPKPATVKYIILALVSPLGVFAALVLEENRTIAKDNAYLIASLSALSCFGSLLAMRNGFESIRKPYEDALAIKEMLYDSVAQN